MSIPASVNTLTQIGFEATPGTAVAATDKLSASRVRFNIEPQIEPFRASGFKSITGVTPNYEDSSFSVDGMPTFEEFCLWAATIIDTPTITTPGGATNARNWQFIMDENAADADESMTIERVNVRSFEAAYAMLNQIGFSVSRAPNGSSSIGFTGSGFAKAIVDGITATPSLSQIPYIPMVPKTFDLFIDDSAAGLGTTGFTEAFSVEYGLGPKKNRFSSLDSSESSFSGHYEQETDGTITVRFPRNATSSALITDMRNAETLFVQLKATEAADLIESGATYDFQLDVAGKIINADLGEDNGLETIGFTLAQFADPTWGQAMELNIVNDRVSLSGS